MDFQQTTTREDKLALINALQDSFSHKGELLLPDEEFYPEKFDDKNLALASKKILMWLEQKPHDLNFIISDENFIGYRNNSDGQAITLSKKVSTSPFTGAAVIARACLEYFLAKKNIPLDDELVELALIEFGLGVLTINSFDSDKSLASSINRLVPLSKKPRVNPNVLMYFSPLDFAKLFEKYINTNMLGYRSVVEHVLPWVTRFLNSRDAHMKILRYADYSQEARKKLLTLRAKAALLAFTTLSVSIFGLFLWQQQPRQLPQNLQSQKEDIEVLEKAYRVCIDSARDKQMHYDKSDVFLMRQLDSHMARCASIRNTHDYRVRTYNKELEKAGFK